MMLRRLRITYITLFAVAALLLGANAFGQTLADLGLTYQGYYDIQTNGNDTSFMRDLTVRYVNGQRRFLTLTHTGRLQEVVLPATYGQTITAVVRSWNLGGSVPLKAFQGIWFEQAKNRLWVTTSDDYTTVWTPASVHLLRLEDNGSLTLLGRWTLGTLPEKRVYGACLPSPVTEGKYACGDGGYTSLVNAAGGASMGPTLYEIPEPTTQASGSSLPVRVLLDTSTSRGLRRTIPINYFDGGDPRPNPSTPPTNPPLPSAQWLSPNAQGLGWFVWGDSYYSTGMYIPGLGYVAIASLCKGKCYYMSSNLEYDWRQWEIHVWPASSLTGTPLTRPAQMVEFTGPFGAGYTQENGPAGSRKYKWAGNTPSGNISGATYDAVTGSLFLAGFPLGKDIYTGRIWELKLGTTPPPPPVDCVESAWSEWSAWMPMSATTEQRTRTRTMVTPPSNGGRPCGPLTETETRPIPPPTTIGVQPGSVLVQSAAAPIPTGYTLVWSANGLAVYRKD